MIEKEERKVLNVVVTGFLYPFPSIVDVIGIMFMGLLVKSKGL